MIRRIAQVPVAGFLLITVPSAGAQNPPSTPKKPTSCEEDARYQTLDFWVGAWNVVDWKGREQGTNEIVKLLKGCVIQENWAGAGGSGEGKSWFYFNHHTGEWKQIWMTDLATAVSGTKEKRLIARYADGGVRFQGTLRTPDGRSVLDRTTLRPEKDGRVRQVIEISTDGGTTWRTTFDAFYVRRP